MRLEKAINPLLDDNDQVAFSFILAQIVDKLKSVENVSPFILFIICVSAHIFMCLCIRAEVVVKTSFLIA